MSILLNDDELANMAGCSHEHTQLERELVAELRRARATLKKVGAVMASQGNSWHVMKARLTDAMR